MGVKRHNAMQLIGPVLLLFFVTVCVQHAMPANFDVSVVNNMLRDAHPATKTNGGHAYTTETQQMLRDTLQNIDNNNNNNDSINGVDVSDDNDIVDASDADEDNDDGVSDNNQIAESGSSVELLRFVNDDSPALNAQTTIKTTTMTTTTTVTPKAKINSAALNNSNNNNKNNNNDNNNNNNNDDGDDNDDGDGDVGGDGDELSNALNTLSVNDQVRLLTKQLNALMTRRREDYEMLEHNLRKSLKVTTDAATVDFDIRNELEQLRLEVQTLRNAHQNNNKERLTIEWLQQSISEIRKQLMDLQLVASNVSKDTRTHAQTYEDLATIRNDYQQIQLELIALRERQEKSEVYVQELREELLQQEEDLKRRLHNNDGNSNRNSNNKHEITTMADNEQQQRKLEQQSDQQEQQTEQQQRQQLSTEPMADHSRRHCRFQHQQIHELQIAQRNLKRQLNELKYHRIAERVRSIEIEQHRIANANFNLSRQIASLDRLHSSMLELLEDVENLQNKIDKSVPELRHEISKLEFANAQISSEQNLLREEGKNVARSMQAMAVSVSALLDERDGVKTMQDTFDHMRTNVDRLQTLVENELKKKHASHTRTITHHGAKKIHKHQQHQQQEQEQQQVLNSADLVQAETLVAELENVEAQYESIIEKLPKDCSELNIKTDGLHLIAPNGQHHPLMAYCNTNGWTTIQRRFDGSADFNRSWVDYAAGFGAPASEYWIGNEQLHHLTLNNCTSLRIIMQDIYDNIWLADYGYFYISSRADGYRLHIGDYSGNASDALNYQQGMQFSAIDDDRDISQTHCAANYEGGWWFSHCQHANLNGRYNLGLTWFDASRNEWIAVKSSQMLVKRQMAANCAYIIDGQISDMLINANGATALPTILSSSDVTTPKVATPTGTTTTTSQIVGAAHA